VVHPQVLEHLSILRGEAFGLVEGVEPEKVVLQKFLSKGSREGKGVGEGAVLRTFGPEKPELAALLLEKVETGVFEEEGGEENLQEPGGQNRQILLRRDDAGEGDEVFPGRVGPPVEKPVDKLFQEGVEGVEDQHSNENRRRPDGDPPFEVRGETGDDEGVEAEDDEEARDVNGVPLGENLEVHELVPRDGVGEGQRDQELGEDDELGPLRRIGTREEGEDIEEEERDKACEDAPDHPLHLLADVERLGTAER